MTPSRIFTILNLIVTLTIPFGVSAKIGLQPGFERPSAPSESSAPSTPPTEEELAEQTKWTNRRTLNQGFWADMMNFRTTDAEFKTAHAARREERRAKRFECRSDIRKANRGAMMPITIKCYRAVLQTELEILRKQVQYIKGLPGATDQYKNTAVFHTKNLSKAITAIIKSIDSGYYEEKTQVKEAKQSLGDLYRPNHRLAMTQLRVSRLLAWINHLSIRLDDIRQQPDIDAAVLAKIEAGIACFEEREAQIKLLLSLEDNNTLIDAFRQEQSDVKFCIHSAREAASLNTELEQ